MVIRCLSTALVIAALLPMPARAEPITIGLHALDGGGGSVLPATISPGTTISMGEITLPSDGSSIVISISGLDAGDNYQMELIVRGSESTWDTLRAEVLDPLDHDDGLDVAPYHAGVPDGFSTSNTRDGLSFAQSAGLERSAVFTGGSATVQADEETNAADLLLFQGVGAADELVVRFGLRDYDGGRNFLVRFSAEDNILNPEPTSMLLIGTGLVGLAAARRRKRATKEVGEEGRE